MTILKLDELAWYFKDSKVHSASVLSIMTVENLHESWAHTDVQKELFTPFGWSGTFYATCHGVVSASLVFSTKEALLESL